MANIINSKTTGTGGIEASSVDTSGDLNIQSGGVTKLAVTSSGAAITGALSATGAVSGTSFAGAFNGSLGATTPSTVVATTVTDSTGTLRPLVSGTAVTASGTSIDFTSIPSWVKRITILLNGVVASSTSNYLVQIGSSSFTTSGYTGYVFLASTARSAFSTGFMITGLRAATSAVNGSIVLSLVSGNAWNETGITSDGDAAVLGTSQSSGNLTLGGVLDRVRVTSVSANTFSAGTINIMYE